MRGLNDIAQAINADLDGLIQPTQRALRMALGAMPYDVPGPVMDRLVEAELELRAILEKLTGSRHLPEERAVVTEARRVLLQEKNRERG